jgi:hypothetical protein
MSRGGARPGAGRPRKPKNLPAIRLVSADEAGSPTLQEPLPGAFVDEAGELRMPEHWETPLQYAMRILNDPATPAERRDRLAQAFAPFVHQRLTGVYMSAGRQEQERAKRAGDGTPWRSILRTAD